MKMMKLTGMNNRKRDQKDEQMRNKRRKRKRKRNKQKYTGEIGEKPMTLDERNRYTSSDWNCDNHNDRRGEENTKRKWKKE